MRIRDLIDELESIANDKGDNVEVFIGMYQDYGSNFVYKICDEIETENGISGFYESYDEDDTVMLIMGGQIGCIKNNEEED